jgi:hypothetical protein
VSTMDHRYSTNNGAMLVLVQAGILDPQFGEIMTFDEDSCWCTKQTNASGSNVLEVAADCCE